jgi:hypothetical protein
MLDRLEPLLKIICLALAALLLFQIVHRALNIDPLGRASIPPLPTLAVEAGAGAPPADAMPKKNSRETNAAGTNTTSHSSSPKKDTNAVVAASPPGHGGNFGPQFGPQFGGPAAPNLPPPIQSRVDRIKESEILGPFIRPMPMALLGIADDDAFLRAPNGQTGLIKEGGELGGIKLLRIGINRVLVEEGGKKKELTLFSGFGSDSLMPKETNTPTKATLTPTRKDNP